MVMLSAAVILAAAPVHVVAVHGRTSDAALATKALAVANASTIDASSLHEYLLRPAGVLPMQDFGAFSAGPVQGWPPSADKVWSTSVAYCLTVAGPPPWKGAALVPSVACANRLSEFLWQRYVAEVKAARVFVVDISVDETKNQARVTGVTWEPSAGDELVIEEQGAVGEVKTTIERVMQALVENRGLRKPRTVVSSFGMSAATKVDPFTGAAKVTTPITLKTSCAALPSRLTVTPEGPLGASFAARWAPAGATGPALACVLRFSEFQETGPIGPMTVVTVMATCGKTSFVVEGAKDRMREAPVDIISKKLAQGLAAKLCP